MKISEFSVKNYQFTVVIFVMITAMGINSLISMPRNEDPFFEAPTFAVPVIYPGTSPEDMEDLIVEPMEDELYALEDIKEIRTIISDGLAVIVVEFNYEVDPDEKYDVVLREVTNIKPQLPEGVFDIEVRQFSPSDVSITQIALISETAPYAQLAEYAENLEDRLEKIKTLKNIESWAYPEQEVRVELNLERMAQYNIPPNRVLGAIQSENANIPGGSIEMGTRRFSIKTSGAYSTLDQIANTIIQPTPNGNLRVKDMAKVYIAYAEEDYLARLNGERCVFVTAALKPGNNIFSIQEPLDEIYEDFAATLPASIRMEQSFDQAASVDHRLSGLSRDFLIAILLVMITLMPLGFRASLVVMISIPLCLAIGLALLDFMGYSINQLSIVGLVVALGLLVDDTIVVVENISRWLRSGLSRRDAAIKGTQQIGLAVVGCTGVLIFAFVPLGFLPEASGDFIRSLPMAVIVTVLASLFVALTIVPFLASLILKPEEHEGGNRILRGMNRTIERSYTPLLKASLKRPAVTLIIAFLIFGSSLGLIPVVGFSVFPKSEKPQFRITIETPKGTSLYSTDMVAQHVDAVLGRYEGVKNWATNVGRGNPRIYYNVVQADQSANFAEVFVQLEEMPLEDIEAMIESLRQDFEDFPNANIEVKQFEQGPPVEAPIAMRVFGPNLDSLRSLAFQVEGILNKEPGTIYVNNPLKTLTTDLQVNINRDKAGYLGIPMVDVDRTIRMGTTGLPVGIFQDTEGDEYTINVTLPRGKRPTLETFDQIYLTSMQGTLVPLRQLADIDMKASPTAINHFDKERYVTITADVSPGYNVGDVTDGVINKMDNFPFPEGYRYVAAGEVESKKRSFGGLGPIIAFAFFSIFAILVLEFKTFKSTLIVLSVIPLGIIGAVLALFISGNTLSFVAAVGIIALMGIEIKNSILLVDFTNQLREEGMDLDEAIRKAGEIRFVPILLTALTAIGGLTPLILEGSPLYSPLAWVIVGGLISSTLLTRVVTPVLYKLLPPKVELKKKEG